MTPKSAQRRLVADLVPEGVVVAIAYLAAHGLMFLNKGIYWDDWMNFRQPWSLLAEMSSQVGSIWPAWTLAALYQSDTSVWIARAFVAICYLLASLWFLGILRNSGVDRTTRLVMAVCFALFPVNGARIPIATAQYGVALALFVGGFRLVVASVGRKGFALRSLAALALLFSLRAASFGVFLPLVYAYVIWREGAAREPRRWLSIAARHAELLAVPLVFVALRQFVFVPYGTFADYNTFSLASLASLPRGVVAATWHSLIQPLILGVGSVVSVAGLVAALMILVALMLGSGRIDLADQDAGDRVMVRRQAAVWLAVGLGLVVLALLPYLLVGKMPALSDFESRHQLLVPFGVAIAMGAGLRLACGTSRKGTLTMIVVAALLFGGFASADFENNVSYLRERYKHIAMVEAMRAQPEFRDATTFLFDDRTYALNANQRTVVRATEYAGMMNLAFGTQTRFGADLVQFASSGMASYRSSFRQWEKMAEYHERPVQYLVDVVPGSPDLGSTRAVLALLATDITNPSRLRDATRGAVRLRLRVP